MPLLEIWLRLCRAGLYRRFLIGKSTGLNSGCSSFGRAAEYNSAIQQVATCATTEGAKTEMRLGAFRPAFVIAVLADPGYT